MTKLLNIGMVGYGFMARAHSNAWSSVSHFFETGYRPVLKAAAARNASKLRHFADMWGYESVESDWRALIERKDIDAIDICVPNDLHAEIAIAAARAGKMVLTEKPLARTEAEGLPMVEAVEKAGVPNMVWYNYRRVPAVMLIRNLVASGKLGKIFHYRAKFLQDWTISPDVPQGGAATWRLDVDAAGSGVTGDLLAHCLDTAIWINGSIASLSAMTETFIKERKHALTGKAQPVGIDDAAAVLTRFANGSLGTFESTRYARGHKAAYTLEINGEKGSLSWDLHDLNRVQFFDHSVEGQLRGWTNILVTDGDHPYLGKWWVPGLIIGYEHSFTHQVADFLEGLKTGKPAAPSFRDALETNRVCDAIIASGKSGQWVNV
ncbi:Gfo/Idh/MocA family protein [Devosia sp.]|uniref:Gfo/Idh/MocA family protein n=1 Tax=Devosia sp. TaxID=1871048 RepID=UPI0035B0A3D4